jgi:hypothetical protein
MFKGQLFKVQCHTMPKIVWLPQVFHEDSVNKQNNSSLPWHPNFRNTHVRM